MCPFFSCWILGWFCASRTILGLLRYRSRTVRPLSDSRPSIVHSHFEGYVKWRREKLPVLSLVSLSFVLVLAALAMQFVWDHGGDYRAVGAGYRLGSWNMVGENRLKMAGQSQTTLTSGMADKWSPCAARRHKAPHETRVMGDGPMGPGIGAMMSLRGG